MKSKLIFVATIVFVLNIEMLARIYIDDGLIHNIDYAIPEEVWVDYYVPTTITAVNLQNGGHITSDWEGFGNSIINILGGSITDDLQGQDNTEVNIYSGSIGDTFYVNENCIATMSGGSVGEFAIFDDSRQTIIGSDFAVNGIVFGYGSLTSILGGSYQNELARRLTGTLDNGEFLDDIFYIGNNAQITLIPEPATLVLLGLSGLVLMRK